MSATKINEIVENILENKLSLNVTKNSITRELDALEYEKGASKDNLYIGINIDEDNLDEIIQFLGADVIANAAHNFINSKMRSFNEKALDTTLKARGKESIERQAEMFLNELQQYVIDWSAREMSKAKVMNEMANLGKEMATATPERLAEIQQRLIELAGLMASK